MNYAAQSRTPNAGALIGSLAIPVGVGALLITSLAVTYVLPVPQENPTGFTVKPTPIEPPPEKVEPERPVDTVAPQPKAPDFTAPKPDIMISPGASPTLEPFEPITLGLIPPVTGIGDDVAATGAGSGPAPSPRADPLPATPTGDITRWITTSDYRTSWINRGFTGTASFTLEIDARGRVSDCTITGSTGHAVLDGATCRLLERRARFDPARDGAGDPVAASYSSSVAWQIPE
ncbi:MAG: energy transducer TonB [Pseudomonadota bacterium]